jgi:hypothetical protein
MSRSVLKRRQQCLARATLMRGGKRVSDVPVGHARDRERLTEDGVGTPAQGG